MEVVVALPTVAVSSADFYTGLMGDVCPPLDVITSLQQCTSAHNQLSLTMDRPVSAMRSSLPAGCSTRQVAGRSDLHWNSWPAPGRGRADLTPICKYYVKPEIPTPVPTPPTPSGKGPTDETGEPEKPVIDLRP